MATLVLSLISTFPPIIRTSLLLALLIVSYIVGTSVTLGSQRSASVTGSLELRRSSGIDKNPMSLPPRMIRCCVYGMTAKEPTLCAPLKPMLPRSMASTGIVLIRRILLHALWIKRSSFGTIQAPKTNQIKQYILGFRSGERGIRPLGQACWRCLSARTMTYTYMIGVR